MLGFADLPARIDALAAEQDQLGVVLLDAFGWAFVQRHADHPFLKGLEIEPMRSQFPSTTTAHLTTLYSGLPVTEHGLYEWRCFEPVVGDVIRPLRFAYADRDEPLTIAPAELFPWPSRCAGATVLQPAQIADTPYGSAAFAGATIIPFETIEEGAARLGALPGLTFLYWDAIDATGHREGPSSQAFVDASLRALDALATVKTPLLVTADHGQLDVHTTDHLDLFWPEVTRHLTRPPAGSARDLFLHVDDPDTVVRELQARLEHRAEVRLAHELFEQLGPRLRDRLADVCVLPAPGRMVGLTSAPSPERRFKGHHGGLTPEESETWIGIQA
ncbi:alkaline phosphatase family protein [Solirubrobacter phytolaccae]|uniref:Alkaline phosphatase family protein n=1 Tax=Solirubrobacter phytolaccae TaxID=1404360 RepID=A0A9X3SCV4_9ACTN|nr:alkaline phosphatase family protein [Solirubrobacter phytolaccae]MDA0179117.1 alkaline phosphatase family protein [Solirubrobacter phytolaccae]